MLRDITGQYGRVSLKMLLFALVTVLVLVALLLLIRYAFLVDWFPVLFEIAPLYVSVIAVIVAAISAGAAIFTLRRTREALELTRSTIRPFLSTGGTFHVDETPDAITLTFRIQNTGSMPGDDVNEEVDFFHKDEEVTEDNHSTKYPPPRRHRHAKLSLLFPNGSYSVELILYRRDKDDMELWGNIRQGIVNCRVRLRYGSFDRQHTTIETGQIVKLEGQENLFAIPIPPQRWT